MRDDNGSLFWVSYADLMTALFIISLALFVLSYKMFKVRESDLEVTEDQLHSQSKELEEERLALEQLRSRTLDFDRQNSEMAKLKTRLGEEESTASSLLDQLQKEREYVFILGEELAADRGRLAVMEEEYLRLREIQKAIEKLDARYFKYQPQFKRHVLRKQVQFAKGRSEIGSLYKPMLVDAGKALQRMVHKLEPDDNIKYLLVIEGMSSKDTYRRNYELSYERALSLYRLWEMEGIHFDPRRFEVMISGSGSEGIGRDRNNEQRNQRFLIQIVPKIGELNAIRTRPNSESLVLN